MLSNVGVQSRCGAQQSNDGLATGVQLVYVHPVFGLQRRRQHAAAVLHPGGGAHKAMDRGFSILWMDVSWLSVQVVMVHQKGYR